MHRPSKTRQARNASDLQFPSPFQFNSREPITLVELRMRKFSGMIRSKPDWWTKVNDPEIKDKWRKEMVEEDRKAVGKLWGGEERFKHGRGTKQWPRDPITDAQLDYIFEELKYEASRYDEQTGIFSTSIPKVYESRSLIPARLESALFSGACILERVPDEEKDWHPGSNRQVLNLVHPSLYCLRIGHSFIRSSDTKGTDVLRVLTQEDYLSGRPDLDFFLKYQPFAVSSKYQWLPTDFAVSADGQVKSLGYINNLHPIHHRELYTTISSVLSRFIPLFERVLSDVLSPEPPLAVDVNPYLWYEHLEEPDWEEMADDDYDSADGSWKDPDEEREEWERTHKWPLIPDPPPFSLPSTEERVEFSLRGRTLQVIVKLANIVLTPENPRYPGGSWHVEGMANERIVATGLYYYSSENITESRLTFRTVVGTPDVSEMRHQHNDLQGYYAAYGFGKYDGLNQELGHVVAEEHKCIAFPNIYQHRVDAFELADPSKPGHRKILCFFLVDPLTRILSTSDVPPQREDWVREEMAVIPVLHKLPAELSSMIVDMAKSGTIGREEAERDREELMSERGQFRVKHNQAIFELEFRMCEH
ncbi:hypothetical protein PYCCODRAFT_1417139 [Trametes coccinea BRFM310]|uniref:Uncharacterized protein n=1 Tax=Trametes coccinea (strain BRFM310) TaxID=1353009 RepID=A0A1Y2IE54_TRAC3|nr:hypothetical protein PYCCODRAFT_1417139 [Trametes coccinea BRFM310]